jgi:hypothetical protein
MDKDKTTDSRVEKDEPTTGTPDHETYLTLQDVARVLRCRTNQIAELACRRTRERSDNPLPVFKLSSKIKRVRKSDLHAWLDRQIALQRRRDAMR